MAAARKISRAAVGSSAVPPAVKVYHLPPDLPQERHLDGLPLGTRGGTLVRHHFPKDGEYVIRAKLALDIADNIPRYDETHDLEILLDGEPVVRFTLAGEPDPDEDPEEGEALRAGRNTDFEFSPILTPLVPFRDHLTRRWSSSVSSAKGARRPSGRRRSTPDGDGSLLDHVVLLYGGGLGDPNQHSHSNLPLALVGSTPQKRGRHLQYPETPLTNLLLAMLDKVGVAVDQHGDSTGRLELEPLSSV